MEHKPLKVEVTADDIASAKPRDLCWCPIAIAIRRAIGDPSEVVSVANFGVAIGDGRAGLPLEAVDFIKAFDSGKPVKPFAFELA